jgi:hypothetical protein
MMKKPAFTHVDYSTAVEKIKVFSGISLELQRRIGTFIVAWGMFEVNCEPLVWKLRNEDPAGKFPTTERMPISELLDVMSKWSKEFPSHEFAKSVDMLSTIAGNLLIYRNAIIHGRAFPGPSMISNASLFGEKRKRPKSTAYLSDQLLDMAAEATSILIKSLGVITACYSMEISMSSEFITIMIEKLERAKSIAVEIRDTEDAADREKY